MQTSGSLSRENAIAHSVVVPREGGGPSTPQLIGSIIDVSGILDHPPEPVIGRPFGRPGGG